LNHTIKNFGYPFIDEDLGYFMLILRISSSMKG
jgi:hypothetical protein